jgi:hypothetical protein
MAHYVAGVAHGSRFIDDTTEREALSHTNQPQNRERFARLSVLFGWTHGSDQQFIYEKRAPHRVYSHDHGHFFPGGPNWSAAQLAANPNADLDPALVQGCNLTVQEITEALARLQAVSLAQITDVVAAVPASWGILDPERAALTEFLVKRREALLTQYPSP